MEVTTRVVPGLECSKRRTRPRPVVVAGAGVTVAAYSWWATGLVSFTSTAYVAVGIPAAALATVAFTIGSPRHVATASPPRRLPLSSVWPWLALAGFTVGLEIVALALGGRSPSVHTTSPASPTARANQ